MSDWPVPPDEMVVDDETRLRPVFESPPEQMYSLIDANRSRLGRYLQFATPEYSLEDAREYARQCRDKWGRQGEQSYAIIHGGQLAGTIGILRFGSDNRAVEIGYWIGVEFEGRGIVTACVEKMLEMCFDRLAVNQVNIGAAVDNRRSRAVAERAGFRLDGVTRQWLVNGSGGLDDMARYSMLRNEWLELRR